jgi:hypothetical protein
LLPPRVDDVTSETADIDPEWFITCLQRARDALLANLEGLGDYDVRRPMTPSGTSLLGIVKHTATVESGYLGDCVGRPMGLDLPWDNDDDMWSGADMWAKADESREWLVDLYRRISAHADESIRTLGLGAPAVVPWWPEHRRNTTLGFLVAWMLEETAQHAGQADVVREGIDGRGGADHDEIGDAAHWEAYVARIQAEADQFRN